MNAEMLEVSLFGVGTLPRLERGALLIFKWQKASETNEYVRSPGFHVGGKFLQIYNRDVVHQLPHSWLPPNETSD